MTLHVKKKRLEAVVPKNGLEEFTSNFFTTNYGNPRNCINFHFQNVTCIISSRKRAISF